MRILCKLVFVSVLTAILAFSASAEEIPPNEAMQHVGDWVTVVGVVSQVADNGKGTSFLNFGGRYPNQTFYAVVLRKYGHKFTGVHKYQGQTIAISGNIALYKGKPQIVLYSPEQVEVR